MGKKKCSICENIPEKAHYGDVADYFSPFPKEINKLIPKPDSNKSCFQIARVCPECLNVYGYTLRIQAESPLDGMMIEHKVDIKRLHPDDSGTLFFNALLDFAKKLNKKAVLGWVKDHKGDKKTPQFKGFLKKLKEIAKS